MKPLPTAILTALALTLSQAAPVWSDDQKKPDRADDPAIFATANPACAEFRNNCRVCRRLPDGNVGCSNVGTACNPDGEWRCAPPPSPGRPAPDTKQ